MCNSKNLGMSGGAWRIAVGTAHCLFALVVVANGSSVLADNLIIEFEGKISSSGSFLDPSGLFSPGQVVTGFWTVDTSTPDADALATRGEYAQTGAPALRMEIAGQTFESSDTVLQMLNDHALGIGTIDAYDVLGGDGVSTVPGLNVNQMQITLRDTVVPLDAMVNDALLTGAPNPASFDQIGQASGQITGNLAGQTFFMNLDITSTKVTPEPGSLAAAMFGVAAVAIARKRVGRA